MNHSFSVEVAEKYGLTEAILLENIFFWVEKNKANNRHYYDGHYWTYNTLEAMVCLFPYFTKSTIHRTLSRMVKSGLIIKGNYNKAGYDRTVWYTVTPRIYSFLKMGNGNPKMGNAYSQNGTTIPDINTDINTDIDIPSELHHEDTLPKKEAASAFKDFWEAYPLAGRKQMEQTQKNFKRLLKTESADDVIQAAKNYAAFKNGETEFVYASYNFVGQKAYYKDYLPGAYQGKQPEAAKSSSSPTTSEQWKLFQEYGENWRDYDAS